MTKTEHYNLNKPEATDPLRLADFNQNADIIDTALAVMPRVAAGTYTGNGAANQTIDVGFTPKAVIAWGVYSEILQNATPTYSAMAVYGKPFTNALTVTENGFTAHCVSSEMQGAYYPNLNLNRFTYLYLAIG